MNGDPEEDRRLARLLASTDSANLGLQRAAPAIPNPFTSLPVYFVEPASVRLEGREFAVWACGADVAFYVARGSKLHQDLVLRGF